MKIKSVEQAIELFEHHSLKQYSTFDTGDYKTGNKSYDIAMDCINYLNEHHALETLRPFLKHEHPYVREFAAAVLLSSYQEECEAVLTELVKGNYRFASLNAEIVLKDWKEGKHESPFPTEQSTPKAAISTKTNVNTEPSPVHTVHMKEDLQRLLTHDTYIYGFGFNSKKHELYFDVDIIKNCIKKSDKYLFRIYPATVVFKNVWDIIIDISTDDDIIISQVQTAYYGIPRNEEYINCSKEYEVNIECLQGDISFKTIGGNIVKRGEEEVLDTVKIGISSKRPMSFGLEGKIVEFAL